MEHWNIEAFKAKQAAAKDRARREAEELIARAAAHKPASAEARAASIRQMAQQARGR